MKSIKPIQLINKGIVIYAPRLLTYKSLRLDILYSKNNPIFTWVQCDTNEQSLWSKTVEQSENGTLFMYEVRDNLEIGFYNFVLTAFKATGYSATGNCLIGVIDVRPTLYIGLPHSAYPPITIS